MRPQGPLHSQGVSTQDEMMESTAVCRIQELTPIKSKSKSKKTTMASMAMMYMLENPFPISKQPFTRVHNKESYGKHDSKNGLHHAMPPVSANILYDKLTQLESLDITPKRLLRKHHLMRHVGAHMDLENDCWLKCRSFDHSIVEDMRYIN